MSSSKLQRSRNNGTENISAPRCDLGGIYARMGKITPIGDNQFSVNMTIQITDYMSAESGFRLPEELQGYVKDAFKLFPNNPYGPDGQFGTITANYFLEINQIVTWQYPLAAPTYLRTPGGK